MASITIPLCLFGKEKVSLAAGETHLSRPYSGKYRWQLFGGADGNAVGVGAVD